jgi:hypothetical protein
MCALSNDPLPNGILAMRKRWGVAMSVNAASDGASGAGSASGGDSNPITVDPGKGWLVTLPVPREVLGKLGGPARLGERLQPIMNTKLGQFGQLTPDASDKLASAYDELFQQLTSIPAQRQDGVCTDDPANPIEVDPGKGRSVTLPVPEDVLGKLGGASQVGERLRPILDAPPGPGRLLTPEATDKLASAYGDVLQRLAAASHPEEQR